MSPELGNDTQRRQPYPMTPQLAKSATDMYAHVIAVTRKFEDVFAANVPEVTAERFTYYASRTIISEDGVPNPGDAQLFTGYRFIGVLLGRHDLDDHDEGFNQAAYEHITFVGSQKLTAANIIRKLTSGEESADKVRGIVQALIDDIPNPDTLLPTAYRSMVILSTLLPYLLVSRTDIKPNEVGQYAAQLQSAMKSAVLRGSRVHSALLAKIVTAIHDEAGVLDGAERMRQMMLFMASHPEASSLLSTTYTAPAVDILADTISNLRHVERKKNDVKAELSFMTELAAQFDTIPNPEPDSALPEQLSLMRLEDLPIRMQVQWEVLPPGSSLTDVARSIVEEKKLRAKKAFGVDFIRLQALENIRQYVGEHNSKYVRGSLKQRGIVRDGDKECPDEYILLLINGADGDVESVIADSPIVGPHAMYVYRRDTAQKGSKWETVFRLDKPDARQLGARAVKHTVPIDSNLVDTMTSKAMELLTCRAEDFFGIEFNGNRAARIKEIARILIGAESEH